MPKESKHFRNYISRNFKYLEIRENQIVKILRFDIDMITSFHKISAPKA